MALTYYAYVFETPEASNIELVCFHIIIFLLGTEFQKYSMDSDVYIVNVLHVWDRWFVTLYMCTYTHPHRHTHTDKHTHVRETKIELVDFHGRVIYLYIYLHTHTHTLVVYLLSNCCQSSKAINDLQCNQNKKVVYRTCVTNTYSSIGVGNMLFTMG